ncbi:MAG: hypothetical protein M1823_005044 [Watsoniomyces obsoletus]|nr:MAG: hypothetical protein M1823_005044 [Watsoniomyces obsoletus]
MTRNNGIMPKRGGRPPRGGKKPSNNPPARPEHVALPPNPEEEHPEQQHPAKRVKTSHHPTTTPAAANMQSNQQAQQPSNDADEEIRRLINVDPLILQTHRVVELNIISSSEIRQKVTRMLKLLGHIDWADPTCKPVLMVVRAYGKCGTKAISVVEIVKSELDKEGAKWYQYSMVLGQTVQIPREGDAYGLGNEGERGDRDRRGGRTIAEWEAEGGRGTRGGRGEHLVEEEAGDGTATLPDMEADRDGGGDEDGDEKDDGDDDETFQSINDEGRAETSMEMEVEMTGSSTTPKKRSVPRLIIFLTRRTDQRSQLRLYVLEASITTVPLYGVRTL